MFKMMTVMKLILFISLWALIECNPYDDGKYHPRKFRVFDDGKYYRPLDEGKYIPGDEGRYTYIYQQGLYPEDDRDYRYVHQEGPNGGLGGRGGQGGDGGEDGNKSEGADGAPDSDYVPNKIDYIGNRTYAPRYPYIHKVIKGLVDKYVSSEFFGDETDSSVNHFRKVYADKEIAVKCQYLQPMTNEVVPNSEFTTQYPPTLKLPNGEKFGSYYSYRGTKVLNTVANALTNKLKLEYEVFVRVVDVVSE